MKYIKYVILVGAVIILSGTVNAAGIISALPSSTIIAGLPASTIGVSPSWAVTNGLIGYWNFDGKNMLNGVAKDASGSGNNGNIRGIATTTFYVVGKIAQGVQFDGVNDRIVLGTDSVGINTVTVTGWVNSRSLGLSNGRIFDNGYFLIWSAGTDRFNLTSDGQGTVAVSAAASWPLNQWVFFAITRTSAGVTNFYVNGVLSGTANQSSGTPHVGDDSLTIGGDSGGNRALDSRLDDIRLYNQVLTTSEITQLYNTGR